MNSNSKTIAAGLLMISCLFSGCFGTDIGVEDPSTTTPTDPSVDPPSEQHLSDWNVHFAATSNDLPDCNGTTNGRLYYVEDAAHFQVCKTSGWEVIDIIGADGKDGLDGASGIDGVDGVDANAVLIRAVNGSACPSGGTTFEIGYDLNSNGQFDAAEVTGAVDICNGGQGTAGPQGPPGINGTDGTNGSTSPNTMLTSISPPAASLGCTAGGRVTAQGLDNGDGGGTAQNGILESGEVDYTTTYCSTYEIWQVDDIRSGSSSSDPGTYMEILVGDTIYFSADDGVDGAELWAHDTSNSSTWQVADINTGFNGDSDPGGHIAISVGDTIYFSADDGVDGAELWAHDTSK